MAMTALAPVSALLVSVALLLMGNGLQVALLPVRAQMEYFSTVDIGALGSAYYVGFALGCLGAARALRRVGHVRVFVTTVAVASSAPLVHALFPEAITWWMLRAVSGGCFAVLYIVIESWLNDQATSETRGTVLAVYMIINLTVITLGQMMLVLYHPSGFELFVLASVLVSLAAVPVGMSRATSPSLPQTTQVRIGRLYRISPVGFMGCVAVGLANGSFWSLSPVFAERVGMDLTGIALFMSATVLGGALGQWPMGAVSDRTDRRYVILAVCAGAAVAALTLLGLRGPQELPVLLVLAALFGFFAFPLYGLSVAHANDHVGKEEYVEVSSGLLLVFAAGAVVGPLLASALMGREKAAGLYQFTLAVHLAMIGFTLWRLRCRGATPEEERSEFVEALQATTTVSTAFEAAAIEDSAPSQQEQDVPHP